MALLLEFLAQQWMLVAAWAVAVAMLVFHENRKSGPAVSPQRAINLVNSQQGVFVDLRDAAERKQGHIADSLHIPSGKLESRQAELEKYRQAPIILVCKMGQHSGAASKQLRAAGFEQVYKMTGGMMEWDNLQLPTIK